MKKLIIIIIVISFFTEKNYCQFITDREYLYAATSDYLKQGKDCDSRVQMADSSILLAYDQTMDTFTPAQVTIYLYDENQNNSEVIIKSLPGRVNNYRQVFDYDMNNNMIRYNYYSWKENSWALEMIIDKTYTPENQIISETYKRLNQYGEWESYMIHIYTYENGRISEYLRQLLDQNRNWYNFSKHFYEYDLQGRLIRLYGQYLNDGPIYWERRTFYDNNGKTTERYFRKLKYNPVLRINELMNSEHEVYSYDILANADTVNLYNWTNGTWSLSGKNVGYFSYIPHKKVAVCHNGITLCIPAETVLKYLLRGDKLGECVVDNIRNKYNAQLSVPGFLIYPNPASENLTIQFNKGINVFTRMSILSSDAKTVYTADITGLELLNIDISAFKRGTYYLKLYSEDTIDGVFFIKK